MDRQTLETRWLDLTRQTLPSVAKGRRWPVHLDHCFQRILLDNAVGGIWRAHIAPPAYRNAPDDILARAVDLGEAALAGEADMATLNTNSLRWRGKL